MEGQCEVTVGADVRVWEHPGPAPCSVMRNYTSAPLAVPGQLVSSPRKAEACRKWSGVQPLGTHGSVSMKLVLAQRD